MSSTQLQAVEMTGGTNDESNQYLTFILADEEYGVDILRVQEIRGWEAVTELPDLPEYIKGVMNLRGAIVPIIDLRSRFHIQTFDYGPTTVVIVLRVESDQGERVMGIVVDAVSEVYRFNDESRSPPPDFGGAIHVEFVDSLATVDDKMVILLDVDRLVSTGLLEDLNQVRH